MTWYEWTPIAIVLYLAFCIGIAKALFGARYR